MKGNPLILLLATVILILGAFIQMSLAQFPVLDGDARFFLPVAVSVARGEGLVNRLWSPQKVYDSSHPEKYNWHGFLYPVVLAKLAPTPDYEGIRQSIIGIGCLTFLLFVFCFINKGKEAASHGLLLSAAALALAGVLPDGGRPELGISLLLALGLCAWRIAPEQFLPWIWGALLGASAATSPVIAFLMFVGVGIYACVRFCLPKALMVLFQAGISAGVVLWGLLGLTPYPLAEWIIAMGLHAQSVVVRHSIILWGERFVQQPVVMLAVVFLCLGALAGLWQTICHWRQIKSRWGFGFFVGLFLLGQIYFSLSDIDRIYNATVLAPLTIYALLKMVQDREGKKPTALWRVFVVGGVFIFVSLPFLRTTLLFSLSKNGGVSYKEARSALLELPSTPEFPIEVSSAFYGLSEDSARIKTLQSVPPTWTYVMLQQANRGSLTPPKLEGYVLLEDHFAHTPPKVLGIKIGNTPGGWGYAIYKRIDR